MEMIVSEVNNVKRHLGLTKDNLLSGRDSSSNEDQPDMKKATAAVKEA